MGLFYGQSHFSALRATIDYAQSLAAVRMGGTIHHVRTEDHMATQTTVTLVDDLDGGVADGQVDFAIDGRQYAIDLSEKNSARLREALAPFIAAARRTGGRRATGSAASRPATDREQNQAIRAWAKSQGLNVSERGRISTDILDAFQKAH